MSVGSGDEERTRVVTAAHALLSEENAAFELTIDAVAARAGVACAGATPLRNADPARRSERFLAELFAIYGRCWHGQRQVIRRIAARVLGW